MQLTIREAAKLLNVPERTVYRWLDDGEIPALRVEGEARFNRAELLEWATLRRLPVSPEILREPAGGTPFSAALEEGNVRYRVAAAGPEGMLRAVAAGLNVPPQDRDLLLEMLLAQGSAALTPVGDGVAIPHVRHPAVASIPRPLAALCFLETAVDVGAPDGKPVGTVFFLVSPSARLHLRLLSRLAAALHDPVFRASLARRADREEILRELRRIEEGMR